jgi:hypothetical protein
MCCRKTQVNPPRRRQSPIRCLFSGHYHCPCPSYGKNIRTGHAPGPPAMRIHQGESWTLNDVYVRQHSAVPKSHISSIGTYNTRGVPRSCPNQGNSANGRSGGRRKLANGVGLWHTWGSESSKPSMWPGEEAEAWAPTGCDSAGWGGEHGLISTSVASSSVRHDSWKERFPSGSPQPPLIFNLFSEVAWIWSFPTLLES